MKRYLSFDDMVIIIMIIIILSLHTMDLDIIPHDIMTYDA